jgi:exopolysaccharide biosynthesis polyprenyl glycosylphosphotransferase
MLKENVSVFRKLMIFADLSLVTLSFFLGYFFRYFFRDRINGIAPLSAYIGLLPVLLVIWGGLLHSFGMYNSFRIKRTPEILYIIFKSALFGFVVFSTYIYIFKLQDISRSFIFFVFAFSALLISFERAVMVLFFRYIRKKGFNYKGILVIGTGERAQQFINVVHRHEEWGMRVLGLVDEDVSKIGSVVCGHKVLGTFKDVPEIVHNNVVDEVVFVVPRSWLKRIEEVMYFCEAEGIKVNVAVDYFAPKFSRAKQTDLNGFPLLTFESTPDKLWQLLFKRLFDVVSSGIALILLSPFFAALSVIIKATSPGPVFFRQKRSGLNGRTFTLYKFRTMDKDAEDRLEQLIIHNEMNGPVFKMENDPRLTKIGKFLRKTSIDELPQLWNVFKGNMSLVGPRPPIPKEVQSYDSWQRRRLSMRPGITCIWQAEGRNRIVDFNEWAKLDLEYIDNWSLGLDFKILLKTIPAVLFTRGAK